MTAVTERLLTYLLVEDNDDHAEILMHCLAEADSPPKIERVSSGTECLAYLEGDDSYANRNAHPYPDVVLLDIRMPGVLDGLQTLRAIRSDARNKTLHVVMLTTSDREADIERAYELGANGYVVKGDNTTELLEKLATLHASFQSSVALPTHHEPEEEETPQRSTKDVSPSIAGNPAEAEILDTLMKADLTTAYDLLASSYRRDRWETLQILLSLSQVMPGRFAKLAFMLTRKERQMIGGGENVDWDFIHQIVMNRLPDSIPTDEFAGLVLRLVAVLDENPTVDRRCPAWHAWQGFQRAVLSRHIAPSETPITRDTRSLAAMDADNGRSWQIAAIVASSLLGLSIVWYLVEKFFLIGF